MKTKLQLLFIALAILAAINQADAQGGTTVFPIATNTSVEELSGGIAASGSNYLVGYLSGTNECFQMVSTNGSLLGPVVTNGVSKGNPFVCASKTNYFEAWFDDFTTNTVGQMVSFSGAKAGPAFSIGSGNAEVFGLASDGTNFLVVLNDNYSDRYFYGQLVTPAGALLGSQFLISSQVANGKEAAVTFGKTNYLVIWPSQNVANEGNTNLTYGAFVSQTGSAGSPFQIGQTPAPDQNFLAVAFDGTNYLAAWMWDPYPETIQSITNWNIYGRLVSQTGAFPGNEVQLVTAPGNDVIPSLAFDGSEYLLTWGYGFQVITNTNIRFQFLDRTASAVGPQFTLFTAQGTLAPLLAPNGLIFDGTRFAMAATLGSGPSEVYGGFIPSSTAMPQLNSTSFTNQQFSLSLTGTPGINYAIQISTNLALSNWTAVVTNSPTNGTFNFTDPQATNTSRFYRAMKQ